MTADRRRNVSGKEMILKLREERIAEYTYVCIHESYCYLNYPFRRFSKTQ